MIMIRAPQLDDIPALKKLFLQLGYTADSEHLEKCISQKSTDLHILIAESGSEVCGVLVMNFVTPVHENSLWAVISDLVINESSRGTGIGKELLISAEQVALSKRCSRIELSSSEKRLRAHKFYENNGYNEVRKRFVKMLLQTSD